MRKFNVTVNGTMYEVAVEEVKGAGEAKTETAAAPKPVNDAPKATAAKPAAAPAAPAAKAEAPKKPVPAGSGSVTAPMPGTVLSLKVAEGDSVKAGQVILILEAMKMENEITAPQDGTVKSLHVAAGSSVGAGDVMVVLE